MRPTFFRLANRARVPLSLTISLLGLLALSGCNRGSKPAEIAEVKPALTVTTTPARSAEVTRSVLASGAIYAWQEVIIAPEVGGYRVAALNVDVGSKVQRGQVLVQLSADLLNAEVASRRAALRSAEARATNAAAALRRGQTMATTGALSQANVDSLTADQVATQAQVETARADLATSELRLRYTQVTAPDDGVVTSRTVSVGQVAQAGAEMLRLLRQGRVEWRAEVPEAQLGLIKTGQSVSISSADGTLFAGKVRTVAPTVQTGNRTALIYADITSGTARPGMFARGTIDTGRSQAVLVPLESLVVQDGYNYVYVLSKQDVVERRRVETGVVRGKEVEVVSGIKADEPVVVSGAGFLKDGDKVRINNAKMAG